MPTVDLRAQRANYTPPVVDIVMEPEPTPVETTRVPTGDDPFFDVSIRPLISLIDGDATNIAFANGDLQAIVGNRADVGGRYIIAVHGDRYRLVSNRMVVSAYETAIERAQQDPAFPEVFSKLGNPFIHTATPNNGGRMFRSYYYPRTEALLLNTWPVGFEVRLINSYDGTSKTGLIAGARFKYNNMSIPLVQRNSTIRSFGKHTANINLYAIMNAIQGAFTSFQESLGSMRDLIQRPVTQLQINELIDNEPKFAADHVAQAIRSGVRSCSREVGNNWFAVYMALSNWASNTQYMGPASRPNAESIRLRREADIQRIMTRPSFGLVENNHV